MSDELTKFQKYIRRIIKSKELARELLQACGGEDEISQAALLIVWQTLFDQLLDTPEDTIEKIAATVQKLYASTNQRKTVTLKEREDARREEEFQEKIQKMRAVLQQAKSEQNGLTPQTLQLIEQQLNLL